MIGQDFQRAKKGLSATALFICSIFLSSGAQAKMEQSVQVAKLTDVTVFLKGAQLYSSATVALPAGESEVVFSNVAGQMHPQSLSIAADQGVMVLSSGVRNDFLEEEVVTSAVQKLKDELEAAKQEKINYEVELGVLTQEWETLKANERLAQDGGSVTVAEVSKMLALVKEKAQEVLVAQARIKQGLEKLSERIGKLERQLAEERSKNLQPGGRVVVKFYSSKEVTANVRLSYVTYNAGWVPAYDLRVDKVGSPVHMVYKASIFQNSGIQWDDVNLTLSTGNPSQGVQSPVLQPWYVSIARPEIMAAGSAVMLYPDVSVPQEASMPERMERRKAAPVVGNTLDGYVTTNAQGINTRFEIAIPYTVPSDGKGHMILVQSTDLAAKYQYTATPKLDHDTFLQAKITDWKDLSLLPGQTSIYFEDAYVGQGRIDTKNIKDGLYISLGREKRVIVERVEDKNNRESVGLFGGSAQRVLGYTINVTNSRPDAIELVVHDQLPVSRDADISVQETKLGDARFDEKTGEVEWTLPLKAGEQRAIHYGYTVRYPKDAQVIGF